MLQRSGGLLQGAGDHRRVLTVVKLGQPAGAVAQPLDLVAESLGDQLAAGQLVIVAAVGSSGAGQPYSERSSPSPASRLLRSAPVTSVRFGSSCALARVALNAETASALRVA